MDSSEMFSWLGLLIAVNLNGLEQNKAKTQEISQNNQISFKRFKKLLKLFLFKIRLLTYAIINTVQSGRNKTVRIKNDHKLTLFVFPFSMCAHFLPCCTFTLSTVRLTCNRTCTIVQLSRKRH